MPGGHRDTPLLRSAGPPGLKLSNVPRSESSGDGIWSRHVHNSRAQSSHKMRTTSVTSSRIAKRVTNLTAARSSLLCLTVALVVEGVQGAGRCGGRVKRGERGERGRELAR